MIKITGKKLKMTQIWRGDTVCAVTPISYSEEQALQLALIKEGDLVRVTGRSRGRGFQGVVKRHGFHGGPKSHGQKDRLRAPGSLGPTAPQRVVKGRKMAGHTGDRRVTVLNLEVVAILTDKRQILLRGAVPGAPASSITISAVGSG